ncbi:GTP-binding protein [Peribacillus cavernae]|uniref:GTP-binding protein n=1 Tax=Peribacillus cavernae TaxID=1674310 RepID=A0A3S0W655_9BACI|nr:dynamin family protein [Peribacillus cavernae]MDQ0219169.1 ribosome biogenesis GTPase A/molybdopterin converting factor small subunit [Peribacillus cavernae]RUQ28604.1 GTP-binding protein [Peribacillus cavernae]
MTSENTLIAKKFYETLLESDAAANPIQILGEAFLAEQKNDVPELSPVRYAQGEVYFHYKDYESAIFKWGSIIGELEPWAKKNMADAYYELGILPTAEEMYKSISTEKLVLRAEVALQLFSLYIEEKRFDLASRTIKDVVSFHPDYPNVTGVARAFFEEKQDYSSAIELAVNESIRTESLKWFDILHDYVDKGYTEELPPEYFSQVLLTVFNVDQARLERLVLSLWSLYKKQEVYFSWLTSINHFFLQAEVGPYDTYSGLSQVYKDTYLELIGGHYFIKEVQDTIPPLLSNWLKLADQTHSLYAAAAVLSWNEIFPESIHSLAISDAENLLMNSKNYINSLQESSALYQSIAEWAEKHELDTGEKNKWMIRELMDLQTKHLLIVGTSGTGKSSFLNTLLGEKIIDDGTSAFIMVKDSEQAEITEITDDEIKAVSDLESIALNRHQWESLFEVKFPSGFLQEHGLSLIDTPGLNGSHPVRNEVFNLLNAADGLVFVLDAQVPFTDRERDMLLDIKRQAPYLQIHFLLNKVDKVYNEQDTVRILEDTSARIHSYLPKANLFAFSAHYNSSKQLNDLGTFLTSNFQTGNIEEERAEKLLYFIRKTLTYLLEKRMEMETQLIDSINWNEEMTVKLNGAINQVNDLEKENTRGIKKSYRIIKEDVKKDMASNIPEIIRSCTGLLKEDSDFRRVHIDLNEAMNERIQEYVNDTVLPKFYASLQEWISVSKEEFVESQTYLTELSDGFNAMYGDERMQLECDFKVLGDWYRDADRMTSGVHIDEVNILMRNTPSQLLLKSAGKLFGALSQNKTALYTRYKKFLETQDYDDVSESITGKFLSQFELFEKSLDRDVTLFFRDPLSVLNHAVEQSHLEIKEGKEALDKMREKPEIYRDPISLFEVQLRQYEWMLNAGK